MSELQLLEMVLRRIAAKRDKEHAAGNRVLDIDTQEFIRDLADELELISKGRK